MERVEIKEAPTTATAPVTEQPAAVETPAPEATETPAPKAEAPKAEETPANPADKLSKFSQEFFATGALKEESFAELEKMGYPKAVVEQFIAGQKAVVASEEAKVFAEVGGAESYKAMTEWASQNMSEAEINAYNNAVASGDQNQVLFAVKGLHARFQGATRSEPKLVNGTSKGSQAAFQSIAQVVTAMSDPRYKTDPAYRAEVERKIANSTVL